MRDKLNYLRELCTGRVFGPVFIIIYIQLNSRVMTVYLNSGKKFPSYGEVVFPFLVSSSKLRLMLDFIY